MRVPNSSSSPTPLVVDQAAADLFTLAQRAYAEGDDAALLRILQPGADLEVETALADLTHFTPPPHPLTH